VIAQHQVLLVDAIVRTGSLTRAAGELGVSAPAISKALRTLEARLGMQLFDRVGRGVRPTRFGLEFAATAARIIEMSSGLERRARRISQGATGEVSLGAGAMALEAFVPDAISQLLLTAPDIRVEVRTGMLPELLEGLRRLRFDLIMGDPTGFRAGGDLTGLEALPLVPMPVAVLCRPGHPVLGRRSITAADLLEYSWVLPGLFPEAAAQLRRGLEGLPPDRVAHLARRLAEQPYVRMADFRGSLRVAEQTDCLTGAPVVLAAASLKARRLVVVPAAVALRTNICVIWDPTRSLSPAAEQLVAILQQVSGRLAAAQ
jgi:DNA-binding transcriptional LysR family regulator